MVVGWVSLGVLIVDLAHTLSYPGMPDLGTESTAQKAITFWLAGRIIAAIGFLLIAILPNPHWPPRLWLPAWARRGRRRLLPVWVGHLPHPVGADLLRPGRGADPTKRVLEYVLSTTYGIAAVLLLLRARRERVPSGHGWRRRRGRSALAELYFTLYGNVTDVFNLMGHIFKVIAYAWSTGPSSSRGSRTPTAALPANVLLRR